MSRKINFTRPVTFSRRTPNFLSRSRPRGLHPTRGLTMNRYVLAASALSTAVGLALALQASPGQAQDKMDMSKMPQVVKDNMARMEKGKLEKCYGINAAAKNDCAEGAHSCAGQATKARDTKYFVLLPAGDGAKIQGGKTTASCAGTFGFARSSVAKGTQPDPGQGRGRAAFPASSGSPRFASRCSLARSSHRELHGRRERSGRPRRDPPGLSSLAPRHGPVARQRGGARCGASRARPARSRAIRAGPRVRASVLERRGWRLSRRPASLADDRGSARGRVPARRSGSGLLEATSSGRESIHLSAVR